MSYDDSDSDRTVPVSDLMRAPNPFLENAPTPGPRDSYRPGPGLLIGLSMSTAWLVSSLAADWPAFGEVSGLFMITAFFALLAWAKR